jgi:hypothetical protein
LISDHAHHGGGITGPRADFQNTVAGLYLGGFDHRGDYVRL